LPLVRANVIGPVPFLVSKVAVYFAHEVAWGRLVVVKDPAALIWIVRVAVTLAPAASLTVMLTLLVPAVVGVPVNVMPLPFSTGVSPAGMPLHEAIVNGPVPPLIVRAPVKPGLLTVHCAGVSADAVRAALTVIGKEKRG
jgi:hypothetical protein